MQRPRFLALTSILLLVSVAGCTIGPPYVNPLAPEKVDSLRVSEIKIETRLIDPIHLHPPSEALPIIAKLMQTQVAKRLGRKFTPGAGDSTLVIAIERLTVEGVLNEPLSVRLKASATLLHPSMTVTYTAAELSISGVYRGTATEEISAFERFAMAAQGVANSLANQILTK
jgi:hypothetical protein